MHHLSFPVAKEWSIIAGALGKSFVLLAVSFYLASISCYLFSTKKPNLAKFGSVAFLVGGVSLGVTFGILTLLFVKNQFQYAYVFSHSDVVTELKYKIAAVWSGQEGI